MNYLSLGLQELAYASGLLLANLLLSILLKLGLVQSMAIAALRMTVQLLLVGYVLEWVFRLRDPGLVLGLAAAMSLLAGLSAVERTQRRFAGIYWDSFVAILASSFIVTGLSLNLIIRPDLWFDPQYSIPILGMILGNTLSGITLALDRFMENLVTQQGIIETDLALGATRWEAAHPWLRDALRTGLIPTLNSMTIMGIVSLPGMMTGQILGGVAPGDAVRYQIAIMFMIAAATALGTVLVNLLAFQRLFSSRHQLMSHRLRKPKKP